MMFDELMSKAAAQADRHLQTICPGVLFLQAGAASAAA